MASEQEIKRVFEQHGYQLLKVKRCKNHDNLHFQNEDVKCTAILRVHIEDLAAGKIERLV